jgi:hypothetical protein
MEGVTSTGGTEKNVRCKAVISPSFVFFPDINCFRREGIAWIKE